jgi:serine/threonine protein kinase
MRPANHCLTPEEIKALVRNRLTPEACRPLDAHLATCARCRDEVTVQRGFEEVRRAFAADPPRVENHVLHRRLGRGGCGVVWLAHHAGLEQWRALKVLRADRYSPAALEVLRREARIMAQLKPHRNRVQVYDLLEAAGMPVLVMDYVAGGSLGKLAPLPWEQAVRYVADAAEGLSEVHALGLRHGDIKPSNLLHDPERDTVLVSDFGLTAHADLVGAACRAAPEAPLASPFAQSVKPGALPVPPGRRDLLQSGPCGWTLGYAAAEVLEGKPSLASDVFALAATLHHLLTGRPPFATDDIAESLKQARAGLPQPPPALSAFPRPVEELIRAGLEPEPRRRPTVDEFRTRLRGVPQEVLADELRRLARSAECTVRLDVTVSVADKTDKIFRPVLTCSNRDPGATTARARTGQLLRYETSADTDGHLTVLGLDSSGDLTVLLPNERARDTELPVGKTQRLTVEVTPPRGTDHTAVIWTRVPWALPAEKWRQWITTGRLGELSRGQAFVLQEVGDRAGGWTAVVVTVMHCES